MKIAVTYENGNVFQHFGHTAYFKLYEVQEHEVLSTQVVSTGSSGHGALAGVLSQENVDVLICGGIGMGAQNALAAVGIKVYGGVTGNADGAVQAFLAGVLNYNPNVQCSHHGQDHGEGHTCGDHGHDEGHTCGSHGCGGH